MTDFTRGLELKIKTFKNKMSEKNEIIIFEPKKLDLYPEKIINIVRKKYKKNLNNVILKSLINKSSLFIKNTITYFFNSIKKITSSLNLLISKFDLLEKKIELQETLIKQSFNLNKELSEKIQIFHEKLDKISENKISYSETNRILLGDNYKETAKINILQEENLRIASELIENRKKVEIMKLEIEKYNSQRTELINKINSVNEVINDTNIVTSVFNNDLKNSKVNILDPNNPKNIKKDIEKQIKEIFIKDKLKI